MGYLAYMDIRCRKGQAVVPEHVVVFFIVVAALTAMTVYVKRALQARVRDSNIYMVNVASNACAQAEAGRTAAWNVDCQGAANFQNGQLRPEYEPYYGMVNSDVQRGYSETQGFNGPLFTKQFTDNRTTATTSVQRPPENAN